MLRGTRSGARNKPRQRTEQSAVHGVAALNISLYPIAALAVSRFEERQQVALQTRGIISRAHGFWTVSKRFHKVFVGLVRCHERGPVVRARRAVVRGVRQAASAAASRRASPTGSTAAATGSSRPRSPRTRRRAIMTSACPPVLRSQGVPAKAPERLVFQTYRDWALCRSSGPRLRIMRASQPQAYCHLPCQGTRNLFESDGCRRVPLNPNARRMDPSGGSSLNHADALQSGRALDS